MTVAGVDISDLDDTELTKLRRDHIGFIFQFFNLLPMLTAAENIVLPLKLAGVKPDQAWLDEVVASVGLTERLKHRPSELSGGQQQRVAVARALVSRPSVMFADEPTGNLDSTTSGEILGLLRDSVDTLGQTTVMVTHDAHAAAIADRVLFLADGDIVRDLGPSTRARDPRDARAGERSMIAVALKGLAGRKVRALLTALAIVIGISMVSGTYILTDTMQKSFDGLFAATYDKTDAVISGKEIVKDSTSGTTQDPRGAARQGAGAARGRSGRRQRQPGEANAADIIGADGKTVARESVGGEHRPRPLASSARSSSSRARGPRARAQVVVDAGTAAKQHYELGDTITVSTLGKTGVRARPASCATARSIRSASRSIAAWDLKTAQDVLPSRGPLRLDLDRGPRTVRRPPS